jgi:hypothetical protein
LIETGAIKKGALLRGARLEATFIIEIGLTLSIF